MEMELECAACSQTWEYLLMTVDSNKDDDNKINNGKLLHTLDV